MSTIIVAAAASRVRGALTMYIQFLDHLKKHVGDNRYYIFVHPSMPKPEIERVDYIDIDITSTVKRLIFDYWGCSGYLKTNQINADFLLSLENTGVRVNGIPQFILYQQGLPFYPQKWNPFKKSERELWFKTYIYPLFVKLSLIQNSKVIVHTPYLRDLFSKKYRFNKERIYSMLPDVERIDADSCMEYEFEDNCFNFIYPANNAKYKEHNTLVRAMAVLKRKNEEVQKRIRIHLTLNQKENLKLVEQIKSKELQDNFIFDGFVTREVLLSMYKSCSGLLFPSTIESVTLPLWEAVAFRKPVICQDLDFAHYQLDGYEGVKFVEIANYEKWSDAIMETCINDYEIPPYTPVKGNSWENLFRWIEEAIFDNKTVK